MQHSQESLRSLAKRYGISPKTVAKWKKRPSDADLPTRPKEAKATVLSVEDEAIGGDAAPAQVLLPRRAVPRWTTARFRRGRVQVSRGRQRSDG
jgi:transposase